MGLFWQFLTDFGDSAVALPLIGVIALYLRFCGWPRAALALTAALGMGGLATALTKIALQSCGHRLLEAGPVNPSGHVMMSTLAYGALALVLGIGLGGRLRRAIQAAAVALVAGIGVSRVALEAHSPGETAIGLGIGLLALALFIGLKGRGPKFQPRPARLALAALTAIALMHGTRWPIEQQIHAIVALIRTSVPACG